MKSKTIKISNSEIPVSDDYIDIHTLKFLKDNPRVYTCTHGKRGFAGLAEEEQQEFIYSELKKQKSVENLRPDVERNGGLMESILIRKDTHEVIEGNSRLAVYRMLNEKDPDNDLWQLIPCDIVSGLSDEQMAAFLSQIHVKGKTQWTAYEKANFAYVKKMNGLDFDQIADLFGESAATIRIRVKVIEAMKQNRDEKLSRFSYYDVIVRSKEISKKMNEDSGFRKTLLSKIKALSDAPDDTSFNAQKLRNQLPVVMKKDKWLKQYLGGKIDFDQAYQLARISNAETAVKQAKDLLSDITRADVTSLTVTEFNSFKQAVRKLCKEATRLRKMTDA